ncbi:MAG: PilZ domain-containing protein [Planctomycetes bacterium]|nr:PilZ domain-containing protein [Planctomycetota bacterium]
MGFAPVPDRRADRRHALLGHARVHVDGAAETFGGIVDVSARGVRVRVRPSTCAEVGAACLVHLAVMLPGTGPEAPAVRLHGRAVVVRHTVRDDRTEELALRFELPLQVGDAFASAPTEPASSGTPCPA